MDVKSRESCGLQGSPVHPRSSTDRQELSISDRAASSPLTLPHTRSSRSGAEQSGGTAALASRLPPRSSAVSPANRSTMVRTAAASSAILQFGSCSETSCRHPPHSTPNPAAPRPWQSAIRRCVRARRPAARWAAPCAVRRAPGRSRDEREGRAEQPPTSTAQSSSAAETAKRSTWRLPYQRRRSGSGGDGSTGCGAACESSAATALNSRAESGDGTRAREPTPSSEAGLRDASEIASASAALAMPNSECASEERDGALIRSSVTAGADPSSDRSCGPPLSCRRPLWRPARNSFLPLRGKATGAPSGVPASDSATVQLSRLLDHGIERRCFLFFFLQFFTFHLT